MSLQLCWRCVPTGRLARTGLNRVQSVCEDYMLRPLSFLSSPQKTSPSFWPLILLTCEESGMKFRIWATLISGPTAGLTQQSDHRPVGSLSWVSFIFLSPHVVPDALGWNGSRLQTSSTKPGVWQRVSMLLNIASVASQMQ